jgi:hypothetical protein
MAQHLEVIKVTLDYTFDRQILLERQEAWKEGFIEAWKQVSKLPVRNYEAKRGATPLVISTMPVSV